jgi:hypothetical protein
VDAASAALQIAPGTAVDGTGRLILLPATGSAVTDPSVAPDAVENVPTVVVGPSGLALGAPTGGGTFVVVLSWREVAGSPGAFVRLHAPWVRLVPIASYAPSGSLVVLGQVTWDATGQNPVLVAQARTPARQQTILGTTASASVVRQQVAGVWAAQPAGGVTLSVTNAAGSATALQAAPDGSVSIGTLTVASVLTTSGLTVTADAEFSGHTVLNDGVALNADLSVHGKHAVRGTDTWLRLNQDSAFTSGTHTPGHLTSGSLNVGGLGGWETAGPGNARVAGKVTAAGGAALAGVAVGASAGVAYPFDYETVGVTDPVMNLRLQSPNSVVLHAGGDVRLQVSSGAFDINSDVSVRGKHAVRGTDTWLRLNQDSAFASGTHTPGLFAPGSLNVGGYENWGNPGGGNALIAGSLYVHGRVQLGGGDEQVIIGGNQTGPFMQLHDDMWLSDPQDGTIELKNAVFGWGRLKGIFLAVSSETYKKDVAPLAGDELSGLLTDALATEVVHFRYREEDDDQPTRLGIIAEQAPGYIVDAPAHGVLLPEYSAMLLGALQALAKRVQALEARVDALPSG